MISNLERYIWNNTYRWQSPRDKIVAASFSFDRLILLISDDETRSPIKQDFDLS